MSIDVYFYTFSKKKNSTLSPTQETEHVLYACNIKDESGIINPVIEITMSGNPALYNYAYIYAYRRFYFIDEWTYYRGTWTASLSIDTLASWKTEIGSSTQYVLRAASAGDGSIIDAYYTYKAGSTRLANALASDPWTTPSLVVGIIGSGESGSMGAVQYYAFNNQQAYALFNFLFGGSTAGGTTFESLVWDALDVIDEAVKAVFNPFQYIASAQYFPVNMNTIGTQVTSVKFGQWSLPCSAFKLDQTPVYSVPAANITIPKHPLASSRGSYLNGAVAMSYNLVYEPFGTIPLDADILKNYSSLEITNFIDAVSGQGRLGVFGVSGSTRALIDTEWAQIGVSVQLAQITQNVLSGVANALPRIAAASVSGDVFMALGSIGDGLATSMPQVRKSGQNGSTLPYILEGPFLEAYYKTPCDLNADHAGKPLCQDKQINTLSGFVKCADGEIEIPCTSTELDMIAAYLTGGFFYE